jgi:hypothetical protein
MRKSQGSGHSTILLKLAAPPNDDAAFVVYAAAGTTRAPTMSCFGCRGPARGYEAS